MSTKIMAICWPVQTTAPAKAVLISLADNANDDGHCWPSILKIAQRTCLNERTVRRAIKVLEDEKLLVADRTNGRHTSYRITVEPRSESPGLVNDNPGQRVRGPRSESPGFLDGYPGQSDPSQSDTPVRESGDPGQRVRGPRSESPPNRHVTVKEPSVCATTHTKPGGKRKTKIPEDFGVTDRVRKWAVEKGHPDPEKCLEGFVLKAKAKNYKYSDWDSAFMTAIREGWKGVVPDAVVAGSDEDFMRGAK